MWDCGYSRETVDALGQFFGSLDRFRIHREPFGTKAVQLYAALMRHRWHEEMVKKEIFDIRVIDEVHIERIRRKLEDDARRAECVPFLTHQLLSLADRLSYLIFLQTLFDIFVHTVYRCIVDTPYTHIGWECAPPFVALPGCAFDVAQNGNIAANGHPPPLSSNRALSV
ncbi:hypothetical protein BC835DRAFT_318317 [Cytidiella melzeri]|nr:hypothetical protein BC835DRAFT_318317 [Cytidiella melzeri]